MPTVVFSSNQKGPDAIDMLNQLVLLFEEAISQATGPQGWSPKLSVQTAGEVSAFRLESWVGGMGAAPSEGVGKYIGPAGFVDTIGEAVNIRGAAGTDGTDGTNGTDGTDGADGPPNTLTIGTVTQGVASASITGTAPNQTLNLVLPKGDQGEPGVDGTDGVDGTNGTDGADGAPNVLTIGSVTEGPADASITGTSPAQVLNLVLPRGNPGLDGTDGTDGTDGEDGAPNVLTIGTVTSGVSADASITGTSPAQVLNLVLPQGEKGDTGDTGAKGVNPTGPWSAATAYAVDDLAEEAGSTWRRVIAGTTATEPSADVLNWQVFAAKGDAGAGASSVSDLSDVDLTGLADGQVLVFDDATDTWKPGSVAADWNTLANKPAVVAAGADEAAARAAISANVDFDVDYYDVSLVAVTNVAAASTVTLGAAVPNAPTGVVWTVGMYKAVVGANADFGRLYVVGASGVMTEVGNATTSAGGKSNFDRYLRTLYGQIGGGANTLLMRRRNGTTSRIMSVPALNGQYQVYGSVASLASDLLITALKPFQAANIFVVDFTTTNPALGSPPTLGAPIPGTVGKVFAAGTLMLSMDFAGTMGNIYRLTSTPAWVMESEMLGNGYRQVEAGNLAFESGYNLFRGTLVIRREGSTREMAFYIPGPETKKVGAAVNDYVTTNTYVDTVANPVPAVLAATEILEVVQWGTLGTCQAAVTIGAGVPETVSGQVWTAGMLRYVNVGAERGRVYIVASDGTCSIHRQILTDSAARTSFIRTINNPTQGIEVMIQRAGTAQFSVEASPRANNVYTSAGNTVQAALDSHSSQITALGTAANIRMRTVTVAGVGVPANVTIGQQIPGAIISTVWAINNTYLDWGSAKWYLLNGSGVWLEQGVEAGGNVAITVTHGDDTTYSKAAVYIAFISGSTITRSIIPFIAPESIYYRYAPQTLTDALGDLQLVNDFTDNEGLGESASFSEAILLATEQAVTARLANEQRTKVSVPNLTSGSLIIEAASMGDYLTHTTTANITGFTFNGMGDYPARTFALLITQGATPRTVTWPASFKWEGGTVPTLTAVASAKDLLTLTTFDGGTTWHATLSKDRK